MMERATSSALHRTPARPRHHRVKPTQVVYQVARMMVVLDSFPQAGELLKRGLPAGRVHPDRRTMRGERIALADVLVHPAEHLCRPCCRSAVVNIERVDERFFLRPEELVQLKADLVDVQQVVEDAAIHAVPRDLGVPLEAFDAY